MLRALSQAALEARSTSSLTNPTRSSDLEFDLESSEDEAENISCCSVKGYLPKDGPARSILKGLLGADSEVKVDSPIVD